MKGTYLILYKQTMIKKKIFLLPCAGASSYMYYIWKEKLRNYFDEIHCIELAGRGTRAKDPFYQNLNDAASDVAEYITDRISDEEYGIFGHSMGALILFEAYYKIAENLCKQPKHLFFSGLNAPNEPTQDKEVYKYDNEKFIQFISLLGGLPEQFKSKWVQAKFLPILRADFKIICDYNYIIKPDKINTNISVLCGNSDISINYATIGKWKDFTNKDCTIKIFNGNHFYLNNQFTDLIKYIESKMKI